MARALYIHWPFCLAKCPYCDFNSHVRDTVDVDLWRASLLTDLRFEAELAGGEPLTSVFFGGGTPSLMPPALVSDLLAEAERLWGFEPDIEITLEANPSSVEAANFTDLAAAGVNRVSLGLQALDDETLRFLGRMHDVEEGVAALKVAQKAFTRVSFDLIYARPNQTPQQWGQELDRALGFGTSHLSLYQLTIEPGTRFETLVRQGKFEPLDDDAAADLFTLTRGATKAAGLPAYEISNHARPGEESRHNLTYWRYNDYVGIGPGAHGRRGGNATVRHRKPENWLSAMERNGNGLSIETPLEPTSAALEALLMGLRLDEGLDLEALGDRFVLPTHKMVNEDKFAFCIGKGLLWQNGSQIGVSEKGMGLLDALLPMILSDSLVEA